MIDISWNEKKLNSFYKKMDNIINNLKKHAEQGVGEASEDTRKYALDKKRGNKADNLILKEINSHTKEIISRIYTNFQYAPFLEYGTGTKAERPHIGKTETFINSGYKYWLLPVEKADREFSPQRIINIKGKQFYLMFATQPYPFMRPTAFYMREKNVETIRNVLRKGILDDIK